MTSDSIDVELILTVITGVAWTIVYIDSIRIGLRHRTYAMPLAALGLNLAWEATYGALDLNTALASPGVNNISWALVDLVWALFDVVIVYTFFRFGRAEFPSFMTKRAFVSLGALVFGTSFAVQWLFIAEFGESDAVRYSGFLQNLLMSGLFISMFFARRGLRGQTLTIAIAKWIGTLAPTILYGVMEASRFILGLGIMCCVFDLVYIGLIVWAKRQPDAVAAAATQSAEPAVA
jgi:hypothetical protein